MNDTPPVPADVTNFVFLPQPGELSQCIRTLDWSATSLPDPAAWPASLRTLLATMLSSGFPGLLFWGPDLACFYNDAYRPLLGHSGKHPEILGKPAREAFAELWPVIGPLLAQVTEQGQTVYRENMRAPLYRNGRIEEAYWTFSYSPARDEHGLVRGVQVVCTETTHQLTRFRNIVDNTAGPIMILKGYELVVEEANQATLDLWRVDRSVVGRPFLDVKPEFREQAFPALMRRVIQTGETFQAYEYPAVFVREGGRPETLYFNFEYVPYREATGDITGVTILATDVTQQVLGKQQLQLLEQEMRLAMEAAELGYWSYDPSSHTIICNDKTRELFGLPPDERMSLDVAVDSIHADDRPAVVEAIGRALAYQNEGVYDISYRVVNSRTGELRYVRATGQAYRDEQGTVNRLSGVAIDVTDDKVLEAALRREQAFTQSLIAAAPNLTYIYDLETDQNSYASPQIVEILGFTEADAQQLGSSLLPSRLHPDDRPAVERHLQKLMAAPGGQVFDLEYRMRHHDGHWVWLYERSRVFERTPDGRPTKILGVATDYTDRKRAAEEIHIFYALAENSGEFIGMSDAAGTPFYGNPAAMRLVGLADLEAFRRTPVREFFFPEDQERIVQEFFPRVMRDGKGELEVRFRHFQTGEAIWMLYNVFVIQGDNGAPPILATVSRNIHAQKQIQLESDRQKRLLETVTSHTQDLIYVLDRTYRFIYANHALLEMWGVSWPQAVGRGLRELGYEEWHARLHEQELDQVVATRQPIRGTITFPHATLGVRYYDYIFVPVLNERGEVEAVSGTTRDITEMKEADTGSRKRPIATAPPSKTPPWALCRWPSTAPGSLPTPVWPRWSAMPPTSCGKPPWPT